MPKHELFFKIFEFQLNNDLIYISALVPVAHVSHIYSSFILPFWRNNGFNDSSCIRFNDYFVRTYVGTEVKKPLFLQNEWNVCDLANEVKNKNFDITNNKCRYNKNLARGKGEEIV